MSSSNKLGTIYTCDHDEKINKIGPARNAPEANIAVGSTRAYSLDHVLLATRFATLLHPLVRSP